MNLQERNEALKQIEELLSPKKGVLSYFVDNILKCESTLYFEVDQNLVVTYVNRPLSEMLKIQGIEALGKSLRELLPIDNVEKTHELLKATGVSRKIIEFAGRQYFAVAFVIENKQKFGEYLILID